MEDVLDMVRKKTILLKFEDISVLLHSRDELEKMLTSRQKSQTYIDKSTEAVKQEIRAIKARGPAPSAPAAARPAAKPAMSEQSAQKLIEEAGLDLSDISILTKADLSLLRSLISAGVTHYDLSLISDLLNQSHNVYILKYYFNDKYEMKEVSSFQIYALLNDISEIIKINPALDELEKAFYPEVLFIVSTDKNEKAIRDKTNLTDMIETISILKMTPETVKSLDQMTEQKAVPKPEVKKEAAVQGGEVKEPAGGDEVQKRNIATLRVESWKIDELLTFLEK